MRSTVIVRSDRKLRTLRNVAREAIAAVKDLERAMAVDVFGRYRLREDEKEFDEQEVLQFLRFARHTYPGQELEVIVVAHHDGTAQSPTGREAGNGNGKDV